MLLSVAAGPHWALLQLPRPNSDEFTFAQAEVRKSEILMLAQTPMLPRHPQGTAFRRSNAFNVHITRRDEIVIYENLPWHEGRISETNRKSAVSASRRSP